MYEGQSESCHTNHITSLLSLIFSEVFNALPRFIINKKDEIINDFEDWLLGNAPLKLLAAVQVAHFSNRSKSETTVDSRYLDFGYLEQPLISKKKSGPCYNTEI